MDHLDEIVKEFLVESHESLDRLDRALVDLEQDPRDRETLASIFRTIHTIKGTCGFLGFGRLEAITHVGENLLSRLRGGELLLDAGITTGLLAMVDAIRRILASIEASGAETDEDFGALIAELERLNADQPAAGTPAATLEPIARGTDTVVDDRRPGIADTSLRVDVGLLDKLMNLVGELVLARNQILQFTAAQSDTALAGPTQRLNLVTSELQEGVMKTRMQPIDNVWSRFPRVVRDLATACGKQVRIEMVGRETDLDKTIIEAIKDPLTHVVRNSVDHGIEPPEARVALGKPAEGVITLRAYHEGGQINIEIADDGAGIDPERVRRKAVERALVTPEQAARLSDGDASRLIFLPGFSTAERITNVSGRGVGMDVVKTNIEKIGGTVDLQSKLGEGTTLRIKIPLTLAIIPALMVSTGGERFAIPQVNLLELVRLEGEQVRSGLERVGEATFHRLRGNLLPLVHLHRELGLASACGHDVVNIVVLKADERQFGLVVDAINDTEEIVVKPLGKQLKSVRLFAGATIMGDGHVALILDVVGLAQQAQLVGELRDRAVGEGEPAGRGVEAAAARTWLLFLVNGDERMAIPLELVARLEEFPSDAVERSGGEEVVQYRDEILPLVSLTAFFGGQPAPRGESRQVIVVVDQGRGIGLVVDQILDVASDSIVATRTRTRPGILGSAVIQQRVTDLLDVNAVVQQVLPGREVAAAAA